MKSTRFNKDNSAVLIDLSYELLSEVIRNLDSSRRKNTLYLDYLTNLLNAKKHEENKEYAFGGKHYLRASISAKKMNFFKASLRCANLSLDLYRKSNHTKGINNSFRAKKSVEKTLRDGECNGSIYQYKTFQDNSKYNPARKNRGVYLSDEASNAMLNNNFSDDELDIMFNGNRK